MTTKNFSEGAETLKNNVNSAVKWFQDATNSFMEIQTKQIHLANETYSKMLSSFLDEAKKDKLNTVEMSKKVTDLMKKNLETFKEMSTAAMKSVTDYNMKSTTVHAKDILNSINETFDKQVEMMTTANKEALEALTKQFDTAKKAFAPTFENSKKEFEYNYKLSKDTIKGIVDAYKDIKAPTLEENNKMLNDINKNISGMADANMKLWSELLSNSKETEDKSSAEFFKAHSHNGNGKHKTDHN